MAKLNLAAFDYKSGCPYNESGFEELFFNMADAVISDSSPTAKGKLSKFKLEKKKGEKKGESWGSGTSC